MTLQLHRPDGQGGLQPQTGQAPDYRTQLRSPRWGKGMPDRRLPGLANPEMNPTSTLRSVAFWVGLAVLTFVVLVAGYGSGFWHAG